MGYPIFYIKEGVGGTRTGRKKRRKKEGEKRRREEKEKTKNFQKCQGGATWQPPRVKSDLKAQEPDKCVFISISLLKQ